MLKKMRWRVIDASMIAFFAVILLIASLVNILNYCLVTDRIDDTLSQILAYETDTHTGPVSSNMPMLPFNEPEDLESNYMLRFFTVRMDAQGSVISTSTDFIASIDGTDAEEYAKKALAESRAKGYMGDYRYQTLTADGRTTICFLNTIREQQFMKSLWKLTAAVAGISLILVFILVYLLSAKAIRPFANNIEQQKQFITDASHELKTPLTSISTSIDIISMEHGDDEWTDNIRKQTERMTKLVGELVTLSKMNEAIPLPARETFSLSDAAWEIVEVYRPQAKAHGKEMDIDIEDDLTFFGEKTSIQQMLSVLLDNAIRYSDDKSTIRFSVTVSRGKIQIEVRNTCHFDTIPDTDRLFDRFYRPDAARSTYSGGTGIGLAIAKAVAEAHGGTIAASCPDGTTMTITAQFAHRSAKL